MHVDIGKFNRRLEIYELQDIENEIGQTIKQNVLRATVWAMVRPYRGYENTDLQRTQNSFVHRFFIRFKSWVEPNMNIVYQGKMLEITQVINIDSSNDILEILAVDKEVYNGV